MHRPFSCTLTTTDSFIVELSNKHAKLQLITKIVLGRVNLIMLSPFLRGQKNRRCFVDEKDTFSINYSDDYLLFMKASKYYQRFFFSSKYDIRKLFSTRLIASSVYLYRLFSEIHRVFYFIMFTPFCSVLFCSRFSIFNMLSCAEDYIVTVQ